MCVTAAQMYPGGFGGHFFGKPKEYPFHPGRYYGSVLNTLKNDGCVCTHKPWDDFPAFIINSGGQWGGKKKIKFVRVISIPPEETFPGDVLGDARGQAR